jgi:hypothetical protein
MKIKTISVSYSRKFNLGDYNSLGLEVTYWADLDESDDPVLITKHLQAAAREDVKREYGRIQKPALS